MGYVYTAYKRAKLEEAKTRREIDKQPTPTSDAFEQAYNSAKTIEDARVITLSIIDALRILERHTRFLASQTEDSNDT